MKSLLKTVTKCMDDFSKKNNLPRNAAIIGGESIILHGVPRTTLDLDILFFCGDEKNNIKNLGRVFASFLEHELDESFEIKLFETSKDPSDPLKHDLIIITDSNKQYKKLDILIANYKWELEGLKKLGSPHTGPLQAYPKPYLVGMKLLAGGSQDDEDIRNLFLIMSEAEKEMTWDIARKIRRDKNLSKTLTEKRRPTGREENDIPDTLS